MTHRAHARRTDEGVSGAGRRRDAWSTPSAPGPDPSPGRRDEGAGRTKNAPGSIQGRFQVGRCSRDWTRTNNRPINSQHATVRLVPLRTAQGRDLRKRRPGRAGSSASYRFVPGLP